MRLKRLLPPLLTVACWQLASEAGWIPGFKLPSPAQVLAGLADLARVGMPPGRQLHLHVWHSLVRVGTGYGAALLAGVPLGLVMGWSAAVRGVVDPLVEILRPIPPLAWIPLSILWFGIGLKSAAFIIFLGAFFPILLNTVDGVRSIDRVHIEAARTLNAGRGFIFRSVLVPGAFPAIMTGMRIAVGIAWMTLVAAEFTGVREGYGLGYMIMTARDIQRPDEIIAGMVVIGLIGLGIDAGLQALERRLIRWR
jgi:ABC-type nitrate/sulfonate/bicarbonate transport system permease component